MRTKCLIQIIVFFMLSPGISGQPVDLHPKNPRYFIYKDKPLVLITSAEHYGAVINAEFDYAKYLNTLNNAGMNYTRIFTGSYVETPGAFGIQNNTLAPDFGQYLAPWERVDEDGNFKNEMKLELTRWNKKYFERLKGFVAMAERLNIIVEVTLFSSIYEEKNWKRNPFNPGNNINDLQKQLDFKKVHTINNGNLIQFQKRMVEKIVKELNEFDNVFYEIQNEPWADNTIRAMRLLPTLDYKPKEGAWYKNVDIARPASLKWQKEIANTIVETEQSLPKKHLIAQNYSNFKFPVRQVDSNISIMNFHYAWPETIWLNDGWNRPVGYDESGFDGNTDTTYLRQAWQFILAGGALFNNLDYSFYVGKEDGTGKNDAPGGGSSGLRKKLSYLQSFVSSMNIVNMQPDFNVVNLSPGMQWQAISEPGEQYAIFLSGIPIKWIELNLLKGNYIYEFISPYTGEVIDKGKIAIKDSNAFRLDLPTFDGMVALKIIN